MANMRYPQVEYKVVVHYGGRDGIYGRDERKLGLVSRKRCYETARELLRDHAVRVEVASREVEAEWSPIT